RRSTTMTTSADQGQSLTAQQRGCIAACITCRDACQAAVGYCLQTRGDREDAPHVKLLRECAARCDEAVQALRSGPGSGGAMAAARDAAARCMKELIDRFSGDQTMEACIEACRQCAASCMEAEGATVPYDKVVADSFPGSDPLPH